jgi:Tfp pilus assembly protein PilE
MSTHTIRRAGFSAVELIIILVVVVIVGLLGYAAYNSFQNKNAEQVSAESSAASDVKTAPTIESEADLQEAESILDQTDLDNDEDAKQLESETTAF